MANFLTDTWNNIGKAFGSWLGLGMNYGDPLDKRYSLLEDYYNGDHRRTLKTEVGKRDDNILLNMTGLAVDRSVSRLFAGGVKFQLPENATQQQEYIDTVWDLNKKEILLFQVGLYGAVFGTPSLKIVPNGITDPLTKKLYPRLVAIFPRYVRIKAEVHNMDMVERYEVCYNYVEDNKTIEHKEVIRHADDNQTEEGAVENDTWVIEVLERVGSAQWQLIDVIPWEYDFPPLHHWKNLPSINSILGDSEIDDSLMTNDHLNFITSNMSKIIKFHASPKGVIFGVNADQIKTVDTATGNMLVVPNKDARMDMLEMQSDLLSSRNLAQDLQNAVFAQAREIDINAVVDKLGALTNFGLKVLYTDALQKNDTKRQLYGDAIKEINRRLLVLNGWEGEQSDPGEITWGSAMPINVLEDLQADKMALDMGVIDKQSLAEKWLDRYGVDWETITANKKQEQADNPPPAPVVVKQAEGTTPPNE